VAALPFAEEYVRRLFLATAISERWRSWLEDFEDITMHQPLHRFAASVGIAAVALVLIAAAQIPVERDRDAPRGVAAVLSPGIGVTLQEKAHGYEIGVLKGIPGPRSHKVVEVAPDYIVVIDLAGITQTRIPIYALAAITVTDPAR
jgi:hypothetical protein